MHYDNYCTIIASSDVSSGIDLSQWMFKGCLIFAPSFARIIFVWIKGVRLRDMLGS